MRNNIYKLLGKMIKLCRQEKNLTLKELACKIKIHKAYLKLIEEGNAKGLSLKHIDKICKGLNIFFNYLSDLMKSHNKKAP